jgi:hypothetical protein
MPTRTDRPFAARYRRWKVPAFSIVLGVVFLVAGATRGRIGSGLVLGGIMFAYAAFLLLVSRASEPVARLGGESGEERRSLVRLRANAMTGNVLTIVALGGFVYQLFTGGDTVIWAAFAALGGVTYLASIFFYSRRG